MPDFEWSSENLYKLLSIGVYALILIGIGVAASRRTRDMRDFYAGGKRLRFFSVAFSARATGESAWLLLGLTGFGAAYGAKGFWIVLGELIGVGAAWMLMSRRFKRLTNQYDSITIPDYLEARFCDPGHGLRIIAAFALSIFVTIYVSAQIHATGKAFEDFLSINYFLGALIGFAVVVIYITRGGFIAVVWSDVFQGLLMVIALVVLPIVGVLAIGGWGNVTEVLHEQYGTHLSFTGGEGWTLMSVLSIIALLGIGLGFMGSPQIFVRFLALRSEKEIPAGAAVAIVWTLLADSGAVFVGMIGRAMFTGDGLVDTEDVLPVMVNELMHPLLAGVFVAVVLSAIMSTIDSLLVVASSAAVRDYYQKIRHPELSDASLLSASRYTTLVLAVMALGIAFGVAYLNEGQGIFWFVIFGWSGIAATFCPTMILSLFWRGMTLRGAKAAMITGFVCVPIFKFAAPELGGGIGEMFATLEELPPSFAASMLVGIVVSLFDPKGQARVRKELDHVQSKV